MAPRESYDASKSECQVGSMRDLTRKGNGVELVSAKWAQFCGNLAVVVVALLFSLTLAEAGYRLFAGLPVFSLTDWRTSRVVLKRVGETAIPDPVLGWTLQPWVTSADFTTIDHGIRPNFGEKAIRTGAILAVGDSFTEGWVDNDESWPAYLERLINTPVVNAGVFGYATDQIVLRAEQLLPIVKPKILIVDFLEYDVFRAQHSVFGAPKPYFTLVNGKLQFHPPKATDPGSETTLLAGAFSDFRQLFGYSALIDHVLGRLAPNYWYAGATFQQANIDAAAVTCALLDRLKKRVDADGVRLILFMQYYEDLVVGGHRSENAWRVITCAKTAGIQVVDQFSALRAIYVADPGRIHDYYLQNELPGLGHMNPMGNQHAAKLLAEALGSLKP